jgi:hypothetical protein
VPASRPAPWAQVAAQCGWRLGLGSGTASLHRLVIPRFAADVGAPIEGLAMTVHEHLCITPRVRALIDRNAAMPADQAIASHAASGRATGARATDT